MWEEVMTFSTKLHLYGRVGNIFPEREKEIFLVLSFLLTTNATKMKNEVLSLMMGHIEAFFKCKGL